MLRIRELVDGQWKYTPATRADLKVGDKIEFTCNGRGRGGHYSVTAHVTKINRKTLNATEAERSYRPGTLWVVAWEGNEERYGNTYILR